MTVEPVSMRPNLSFFDQVVGTSQVYLGSGADKFLSRQVESHLNKPPQQMSQTDLARLIDWIRLAVTYIIEDSARVDEYTAELRKLSLLSDNKLADI